MKIGDKVRCVYSTTEDFTVGSEYEIISFDERGNPTFSNDENWYSEEYGYPLKGCLWKFEVVQND